MKIALVGIGKIAVDQHVPALANDTNWDLAATASRLGSIDGVEAFTDINDLLGARADIPVISICVPPVPRFDIAAAAIRAGRHVMLEKPPGATLAECYTLIQMAQDAGVTLFATWHSREADMVPAAKAWLENASLKSLTITWKEDVRRWHPGQDWVFEPGGMGVFDPGINALSILTKILPDAIHVKSAELFYPANRQTPIAADIIFAHPNGADVSANFDWRQEGPQTWSIDATTDSGHMCLSNGGATLEIDGEEISHSTNLSLSGEYPRLYQSLTQLINTGQSDVDLSPLIHVTDALMLGRRTQVDPFNW